MVTREVATSPTSYHLMTSENDVTPNLRSPIIQLDQNPLMDLHHFSSRNILN